MSKSFVLHKCGDCGKERHIQKYALTKANFTGLCMTCRVKQLHKKMRNRPLDKRPTTRRKDGYLEIHLNESHWCRPMAAEKGSILVHRLIMAEHLGRLLEPEELVHHKNGIKDDNRITNLELTTLSQHGLSYQDGYIAGLKDGISLRDKELEKQIRILRLQIRGLAERLQMPIPSKEELWQELTISAE